MSEIKPTLEQLQDPYVLQLIEALSMRQDEIETLADALNHVVWVKYCGIDGRDEEGVYRNFPDEERDKMYDVAVQALKQIGRLSENMKDATSRGERVEVENFALVLERDNLLEENRTFCAEISKWKERCESLANFNPNWDMLEATQSSLREHMAEIKRLREELRKTTLNERG